MSIHARIAEAKLKCENITGAFANVVYLGFDEARELGSSAHAKVFSGAAQYVDGLRIIEVKLSNYLQVAYVEGVQ